MPLAILAPIADENRDGAAILCADQHIRALELLELPGSSAAGAIGLYRHGEHKHQQGRHPADGCLNELKCLRLCSMRTASSR
jgi:hypothetical protein